MFKPYGSSQTALAPLQHHWPFSGQAVNSGETELVPLFTPPAWRAASWGRRERSNGVSGQTTITERSNDGGQKYIKEGSNGDQTTFKELSNGRSKSYWLVVE